MKLTIGGCYLQDGSFLSADLEFGEQSAVCFAQRPLKARFFLAPGLEDGLSVFVGDSNAKPLNDHAPGIRQPIDAVAELGIHDGSISPIRKTAPRSRAGGVLRRERERSRCRPAGRGAAASSAKPGRDGR